MWSKSRHGSRTVAGALVAAGLLLGGAERAFAAGTLDDWWLCVDKCAEEDAACVDACTDEYNRSNVADPIRTLKLKAKEGDGARTAFPGATSFAPRCPAGTVLSPFDMPIYDEKGLFVIGFETVWVCLPADLEPAG
jgi:hypothetical protein